MAGKSQYIAEFYEKDGCLFFHLIKPSCADIVAAPFEFEGPANSEHIKAYSSEYKKFQKLKEEATKANIEKAVEEYLQEEKDRDPKVSSTTTETTAIQDDGA